MKGGGGGGTEGVGKLQNESDGGIKRIRIDGRKNLKYI